MSEYPENIFVGERFGKREWTPTDPHKELINSTKYTRADLVEKMREALEAVRDDDYMQDLSKETQAIVISALKGNE